MILQMVIDKYIGVGSQTGAIWEIFSDPLYTGTLYSTGVTYVELTVHNVREVTVGIDVIYGRCKRILTIDGVEIVQDDWIKCSKPILLTENYTDVTTIVSDPIIRPIVDVYEIDDVNIGVRLSSFQSELGYCEHIRTSIVVMAEDRVLYKELNRPSAALDIVIPIVILEPYLSTSGISVNVMFHSELNESSMVGIKQFTLFKSDVTLDGIYDNVSLTQPTVITLSSAVGATNTPVTATLWDYTGLVTALPIINSTITIAAYTLSLGLTYSIRFDMDDGTTSTNVIKADEFSTTYALTDVILEYKLVPNIVADILTQSYSRVSYNEVLSNNVIMLLGGGVDHPAVGYDDDFLTSITGVYDSLLLLDPTYVNANPDIRLAAVDVTYALGEITRVLSEYIMSLDGVNSGIVVNLLKLVEMINLKTKVMPMVTAEDILLFNSSRDAGVLAINEVTRIQGLVIHIVIYNSSTFRSTIGEIPFHRTNGEIFNTYELGYNKTLVETNGADGNRVFTVIKVDTVGFTASILLDVTVDNGDVLENGVNAVVHMSGTELVYFYKTISILSVMTNVLHTFNISTGEVIELLARPGIDGTDREFAFTGGTLFSIGDGRLLSIGNDITGAELYTSSAAFTYDTVTRTWDNVVGLPDSFVGKSLVSMKTLDGNCVYFIVGDYTKVLIYNIRTGLLTVKLVTDGQLLNLTHIIVPHYSHPLLMTADSVFNFQ